MAMQLPDIFLLIVAALAGIAGFRKGIIRQMGSLVGIVVAILVCRLFGPAVCKAVVGEGSAHPGLYTVLSYTLLFVLGFVGVRLVAHLLHLVVKAMCLGAVDRIAGAVFCIAEWMLVLSIALNIYFAAVPGDYEAVCPASKPWRGAVAKFAPAVVGYLHDHATSGQNIEPKKNVFKA